MNIKAKKNFKMSKIFFNNNYANGTLFLITLGYVLNFMFEFFTGDSIPLFALAMITIGVWIFVAFLPVMESAYIVTSHRYEERIENVQDLFKSVVYLIIVVSIVLYNADRNSIHPPDQRIPVAAIKVFEQHQNKDWFGIRYYDADENLLYTDYYTKLESRDGVLGRIYDSEGNIAVDMVFRRVDGDKFVLISGKIQKFKKEKASEEASD